MKPLKDWIILEEIKQEISKVIITEDIADNDSNLAKVLEIGESVKQVKKDDVVLIQRFGFTEIEHEKKRYLIGKEDNILVVC